jgi:hypothetical protein
LIAWFGAPTMASAPLIATDWPNESFTPSSPASTSDASVHVVPLC